MLCQPYFFIVFSFVKKYQLRSKNSDPCPVQLRIYIVSTFSKCCWIAGGWSAFSQCLTNTNYYMINSCKYFSSFSKNTEWCCDKSCLWPNCGVWCGEENKMFVGYKTCIIVFFFFKYCEQSDCHPATQQHLEKVEVIEILNCIGRSGGVNAWIP